MILLYGPVQCTYDIFLWKKNTACVWQCHSQCVHGNSHLNSAHCAFIVSSPVLGGFTILLLDQPPSYWFRTATVSLDFSSTLSEPVGQCESG